MNDAKNRNLLDWFKRLSTGNALNVSVSTIPTVDVKQLPDATSTYCPSSDDSTVLEASSITKASPGVVYGGIVYNSSGSDLYFQLHNTTSVPIDTSVPLVPILVPAGSQVTFDFGKYGKYFSTGITWCGSSTFATKTISGSVLWVNIQYK